ncbi:MAG: arylsulfatase [Opitutales bacterium]
MKINRLIPTLTLALILHSLQAQETDDSQGSPERPNLIVILVDDMGWSDVGAYGGEIRTPNLDRLANEGMRFRHFYNTSKCFPSRACLLTGRYAQEVGMAQRPKFLENALTLGEALRPAGYYTVAVGKQHGRDNLYDRGFDHFYGLLGGASNHFNPGGTIEMGYANKGGRDRYAFDEEIINPYMPDEEEDFYTTDNYTDWAIELLEKKPEDKENFLLYLSYTTPHDPLQAWPEDIKKYEGTYDEGYAPIRQARWEKQKEIGIVTEAYELPEPSHDDWSELDEEQQKDQARRMQVYAAMIDSLDQNLGRLFTWLEEKGYMKNTVILFMSDNGSNPKVVDNGYGEIGSASNWASLGRSWANVSNTPLRYYKNDSYEGGIRTPLIAWWPDGIEAGSFTNYNGHFIDLLPTLLDIAGAEYPATQNGETVPQPTGKSLLPAFQGKAEQREGPLFFQWGRGAAMIENDWKIVRRSHKGGWSLYNLREDPAEINDLAEEQPERVQEMGDEWENWLENTESGEQK